MAQAETEVLAVETAITRVPPMAVAEQMPEPGKVPPPENLE